MREIKFRAWNGTSIEQPVYDAIKQYGSSKAKPYILMQFTGVRDKNGKEIYEGDVLKARTSYFDLEAYMKVYYNLIDARFEAQGFRWVDEEATSSHRSLAPPQCEHLFGAMKRAKVIGNIYENPELLEGAAKAP